jgi:uncharacterized membrane protein YfcA
VHIDLAVAIAGLLVGVVVGLTGMGGGALMTPLLVLGFGVQPLAAVSSDLVAAVVMKPVGSAVHLRRGTVNRGLVLWLSLGSVPAAFAGVVLLRSIGTAGGSVQDIVELALGAALVLAAVSLVAKSALAARRGGAVNILDVAGIRVRPAATVLVGVAGGLIVGMTSVGSGSLMIVLLLALYPRLTADRLVGTDLVQAVPLVGAAALAHLLFGDVHLALTLSLILGSVPGVYVGARLSARRSSGPVVRAALFATLGLSGAKLLGANNATLAGLVAMGALVAVGIELTRRRYRSRALLFERAGIACAEPLKATSAGTGPGWITTESRRSRACARRGSRTSP